MSEEPTGALAPLPVVAGISGLLSLAKIELFLPAWVARGGWLEPFDGPALLMPTIDIWGPNGCAPALIPVTFNPLFI